MRRLMIAVLMLGALTGAGIPTHPVSVQNGYGEVTTYRDFPNWVRGHYVTGVIDGLFVSTLFGASEEAMRTLKACLNGVNSVQLTAIVDKYINDHPGEWQNGTQIMVYRAMREFCPAMLTR